MIVLDASAVVELLLYTSAGERVEARVLAPGVTLHAPHVVDVEVAQVVRRQVAAGQLPEDRGRRVVADLAAFSMRRYGHASLLERMWSLRGHLSAYDAAYVALAEALGAPLLTRDARLARAGGHQAAIEVIS